MEGNLSDVQEHGVIPRSASVIFDILEKDPDYVSSTVYCSLLEIYNEELSDLLVDSSSNNSKTSSNKRGAAAKSSAPKLAIMEGENGPFCRGLSESVVTSAEDLLALMQKAHQQRHTGETDMNKESSRSHCIFTLRIKAKRRLVDGSMLEVGGKLHCVDLAGSECAKSCGNQGKQQAARERERMNINRSLLTLGRVVKLLKEKSEKPSGSGGSSSVRIPYRDSKLTRILQESLGGRCKTCLIATISPSVTAIEESMSTLNYAQAANGIINKPKTTSLMSVGGLDNRSPRGEGAAGNAVEHWHEMECRLEYMQSQVDEAQQALARKHIQHQEFLERAEKAELAQELAERKFEKATHEISVLETKVSDVEEQLEASEQAHKETKAVLGATQSTEASLTEEANALLEVLQSTIANGDQLHEALLEKRQEDVDRKTAARDYQTSQTELLQELLDHLQEIESAQMNHRSALEVVYGDHKEKQLKILNQHADIVEAMKNDCLADLTSLKTSFQDGILPVFATLKVSSQERLQALIALLENGESGLKSKCVSIVERLNDNSTRIAEMEESYKSSSKSVLSNLASHLQEAQQTLTETAVRITESLESASANRQVQREELTQSIDSFASETNQSIDKLEALSNSHTESLRNSIESIQNSQENRQTILQSISDLESYLGKRQDKYVKELERQVAILTKQHEVLVATNQHQQDRNKAMVSNVMRGMQALLDSEMASMGEFQSKIFQSMVEANEQSKACNDKVRKFTKDTFTRLGDVNSELNTNIQQNFVVQDDLCTALETETSEFGASLTSATSDLRKPIANLAENSSKVLQKSQEMDQNTTQDMVGTTQKLVEEVTTQLSSTVQEGLETGLSKLQTSNTEGWEYVREQVLDPVRTEAEEGLPSLQNQLTTAARSEISVLETKLDSCESALSEGVEKGIEITTGVEERLEVGANKTISGTINNHKELIRGSNWLESAMQTQEENVTHQVAQSSALVSSSTESLEGFANTVMMVNEETPQVQERHVPEYSNELTSTEEREVILQKAGLYRNPDTPSEPCTDEPNDENAVPSTQTNSNDSKMVVVEEQSTRRSSVLGERTDNQGDTKIADSPPLKRTADRTKSNLPNLAKRSSKRVKTNTRK